MLYCFSLSCAKTLLSYFFFLSDGEAMATIYIECRSPILTYETEPHEQAFGVTNSMLRGYPP